MASGDNVDVIEVVETTNFPGPAQPKDHLKQTEQSAVEEDCKYNLSAVSVSTPVISSFLSRSARRPNL